MEIAVIGATGTVGRHLLVEAGRRGHTVRALSRASGFDVLDRQGSSEPLRGCEALIDVTNVMTLSARRSRRFFEASTTRLLRAGAEAGIAHHVALSVVGIDDIDAGYYAGKLVQESLLAKSDRPVTLARASQFHEFVGQLLDSAPGPVAVIPRMPVRPIAAAEIAAHLLDLVDAGPQGRAADLVGPQDEVMADLARRLLQHRSNRKRVLELRLPGRYGSGIASGVLRGTDDAARGRTTFDEWLDSATGGH